MPSSLRDPIPHAGAVITLAIASMALGCSGTPPTESAPTSNAKPRHPGPHVVTVDYEALYRRESPPEYEPFDVYGLFLMSVATQETPLVINPQTPVPDHVALTRDVTFKEVDGEPLSVDVYRPKGDTTPNPLILIIHGGYWKTGDKSVHVQQGIEFAELGYTAASVNYRLSAEHGYPANVEDIYDCLRFLGANATEFNIDPSRIVTYGGSAGGHLSAFIGLAANSDGESFAGGIDPAAFRGVITLYGMHDLTLPIQREHPFTQQYIGATYDEAPATYRAASPVTHVDENDPPVLIVHGSLDGSVSVRNSDRLAATLAEAGVPHTYDRVEGWPHAMDFFSPIYERTTWHVHRFLRANMPSDEMKVRD